jgi:hypothetical protein
MGHPQRWPTSSSLERRQSQLACCSRALADSQIGMTSRMESPAEASASHGKGCSCHSALQQSLSQRTCPSSSDSAAFRGRRSVDRRRDCCSAFFCFFFVFAAARPPLVGSECAAAPSSVPAAWQPGSAFSLPAPRASCAQHTSADPRLREQPRTADAIRSSLVRHSQQVSHVITQETLAL